MSALPVSGVFRRHACRQAVRLRDRPHRLLGAGARDRRRVARRLDHEFTRGSGRRRLHGRLYGRQIHASRRAARRLRLGASRRPHSTSSTAIRKGGFYPWPYPPSFLFVAATLATAPVFLSMLTWTLATFAAFAAAIARISSSRRDMLLMLATPAAWLNLYIGQNGALTAALIGFGLILLPARPVAAGICIGLLSVKPHLGLLIPVALLAGGYYRAFASAAVTVVALALVNDRGFRRRALACVARTARARRDARQDHDDRRQKFKALSGWRAASAYRRISASGCKAPSSRRSLRRSPGSGAGATSVSTSRPPPWPPR